MKRSSVGLLVAALLAVQAPGTALAFRTLADDDPTLQGPVVWDPATVPVALHDVMPRGVLVSAAHDTLRRAASAWTTLECSALRVPSVTVTSAPASPDDGRVVVQTLRAAWRERGFSSDIAATTDIVLELREAPDGGSRWVIADADILVNDLDYQWSADPQDVSSERRDLRAVLTHELGHGLVGLAHGCSYGQPRVPECSSGAAAGTTMHPDYNGRAQSELSTDDTAGACFVYPTEGCEDHACADACVEGECRALCEGRVCASGSVCEAGACAPCIGESCPEPPEPCTSCGAGLLGDPCEAGQDCASGRCAGGACVAPCGDPPRCPAEHECRGGVCVSPVGLFGAACEVPSDCASELCLDTGTETYCTRECGPSAECPAGYACERVGPTSVCAPTAPSGCAASPASRSAAPWFCVALVLIALARRTVLRRRSS